MIRNPYICNYHFEFIFLIANKPVDIIFPAVTLYNSVCYLKRGENTGVSCSISKALYASSFESTIIIHTRARTKRLIKEAGAKTVLGLDDLLNAPVDGSGYNPDYGILGSNKATEGTIKLFPINCKEFVEGIQSDIKEKTGKTIEVMVYGDGAFKDPVGKIWELADPVVSPGYTSGLIGQPNELKLKYLADNDFGDLRGNELKAAIEGAIKEKDANLVGQMATEGTTPRHLTDLLGSLCDLTSGSGDKGTPFIYIQGYFDNYTD